MPGNSIATEESRPESGIAAEEIKQTEEKQTEVKQTETEQNEVRGVSAETEYVFQLAYDKENHQLAGTMKATIRNCSGDSWDKIVINDWATTPYYEAEAYSNYAPTDFMNSTITMGDEVIPVVMQRKSNLSSLDVDAKRVIPDGETIVFATDFVVHIPYVQYRYGYTIENDIERVALGNALPVLGLYKDGDWVTHNYIEIGESFNSEVADYDVTFTCPPEYEVVMTGIPEVTDSTYHSVEKCIRDFTIMLATQHTTYVEDHNGLRITVWGNNEFRGDLPKFAEQTGAIMDFYTELVGPYLYMESIGLDVTALYVPESYKVYYDMCASVGAMADDKYYLMSAYAYGPTFLRDLHALMGDEAFSAALHEIYDTYIFKQADTEGVLNIFRKHSQESLEDLVDQYFKNN